MVLNVALLTASLTYCAIAASLYHKRDVTGVAVTRYRLRQIGALNTEDYTLYLENQDGVPISFFHDVPLYPSQGNNKIVNMVVEIPEEKNAKLEIQKEIALNPMKQKVSKHGLKFISNVNGITGYVGNYGSIPQTWEDPTQPNTDAGTAGGDDDPIDIVDIGASSGYPGQVKQVKVLGGLLMVDDNQTDWKLLALDVNDPHASHINDIGDMAAGWPGKLDQVTQWLTDYKVPQNGEKNVFAFQGNPMNSDYVSSVIQQSHKNWQSLVSGQRANSREGTIHIENLSVSGSARHLDPSNPVCVAVPQPNPQPPQPVPEDAIKSDEQSSDEVNEIE